METGWGASGDTPGVAATEVVGDATGVGVAGGGGAAVVNGVALLLPGDTSCAGKEVRVERASNARSGRYLGRRGRVMQGGNTIDYFIF